MIQRLPCHVISLYTNVHNGNLCPALQVPLQHITKLYTQKSKLHRHLPACGAYHKADQEEVKSNCGSNIPESMPQTAAEPAATTHEVAKQRAGKQQCKLKVCEAYATQYARAAQATSTAHTMTNAGSSLAH